MGAGQVGTFTPPRTVPHVADHVGAARVAEMTAQSPTEAQQRPANVTVDRQTGVDRSEGPVRFVHDRYVNIHRELQREIKLL